MTAPSAVSMSELLASCAAADAVSRPPRATAPTAQGARGAARPATTLPHPKDDTTGRLPRSA
ncbi:hypothetical protein [Streptomyces sp. NPDC018693]|uniref:hypothetical protein n=1 Tax=unclassified Streptomyces TaxID=2593676 RepID=UPI003799BADF